MAKKRALLPHVSAFLDRHGKERHRFRRTGFKGGYFHAEMGTPEYLAEYRAFMAKEIAPKVERRKVVPRSIDDLLTRYYASTDFKGNAQLNSLSKRRATLEAFRNGVDKKGNRRGDKLVAQATFAGLDRIIAKASERGEDGKGGPFAAQFLKKQLNGLFRYAVKIGWIDRSPMEFVSYSAPKTRGYHTWSEDEIAQYQAHWPLGSKQRLAVELLLWTGKRRSDGILLGKQNLREGMMWGRDQKTQKEWWLPIAPQLQEAIDAMPPHDHLCYLVSERGRPYSSASFGNMFKQWCIDAGLPHCTAHGLRKAIARRMAEVGINNAGGKSVTLHSGDSEYAIYTAAANQKRLAKDAIGQVSDWDLSNRSEADLSNLPKKAR